MAGWLLDLRYAWRLLLHSPGASVGAVVTLALGIGVTTAIYGVVHAVLLKPLPYFEPDRLVIVGLPRAPHPLDVRWRPLWYPILGTEARAMAARTDIFESVTPFELWTFSTAANLALADAVTPEVLRGGLVEPAFFDVLGVRAALGRTFHRGDWRGDVVVISDAFWRRRFGGDPGILGRTIRLDGAPRTVVGVLPAHVEVTYPVGTEVWGLLAEGQVDATGRNMMFHTIARLQPGVSVAQATAALAPIMARRYATRRGPEPRFIAQPVEEWAAGAVGPALLLVSGAAALLLLAACATAGLLLLGRALRRAPETAVRAALGASRGRLMRQALVESTVVGMIAAACAVLVAAVLHPAVRWVAPPAVPRLDELAVDLGTLLWAACAGLLCAVLTGLVAHGAFAAAGGLAAPGQAGATVMNARGLGWSRVLLIAQTALVVALLAGAGLLLHSFWKLRLVDLGFESTNLVAFETAVKKRPERLPTVAEAEMLVAEEVRFREALQRRLRAIPGVRETALTGTLPFADYDGGTRVPLGEPVPSGLKVDSHFRIVSPEFFRLLRLRLLAGRFLSDRDTRTAPRVVVVSQSLGRALFGESSPVGRTLYWNDPYEIVGVVEDVRWRRPDEDARPAFYLSSAQENTVKTSVIADTALDLASFATAARHAVRTLDPDRPITRMTTVPQLVSNATSDERFYALATAAFAALALVIAAVGIFGAVSASVAARVREIGIRIALGAGRGEIQRLVMRQGYLPVLAGLGLGGLAAVWVARALRSLLFEVGPLDPVTFLVVPVLLLGTSLLAAWLPARRTLRIDPVDVLREP